MDADLGYTLSSRIGIGIKIKIKIKIKIETETETETEIEIGDNDLRTLNRGKLDNFRYISPEH